ncbi:MAG: hypothetical protein ABII90_13770 [Bacteroidota bacterium]
MEKIFTLKDYIRLIKEEKETFGCFDIISNRAEKFKPPQSVIDNILNYSRALSIRKSKWLGSVEMILN